MHTGTDKELGGSTGYKGELVRSPDSGGMNTHVWSLVVSAQLHSVKVSSICLLPPLVLQVPIFVPGGRRLFQNVKKAASAFSGWLILAPEFSTRVTNWYQFLKQPTWRMSLWHLITFYIFHQGLWKQSFFFLISRIIVQPCHHYECGGGEVREALDHQVQVKLWPCVGLQNFVDMFLNLIRLCLSYTGKQREISFSTPCVICG